MPKCQLIVFSRIVSWYNVDTNGLNAFVRHLYCSIMTNCTGIVARAIIDVGMRAKVFTLETLHAVNTQVFTRA